MNEQMIAKIAAAVAVERLLEKLSERQQSQEPTFSSKMQSRAPNLIDRARDATQEAHDADARIKREREGKEQETLWQVGHRANRKMLRARLDAQLAGVPLRIYPGPEGPPNPVPERARAEQEDWSRRPGIPGTSSAYPWTKK